MEVLEEWASSSGGYIRARFNLEQDERLICTAKIFYDRAKKDFDADIEYAYISPVPKKSYYKPNGRPIGEVPPEFVQYLNQWIDEHRLQFLLHSGG